MRNYTRKCQLRSSLSCSYFKFEFGVWSRWIVFVSVGIVCNCLIRSMYLSWHFQNQNNRRPLMYWMRCFHVCSIFSIFPLFFYTSIDTPFSTILIIIHSVFWSNLVISKSRINGRSFGFFWVVDSGVQKLVWKLREQFDR